MVQRILAASLLSLVAACGGGASGDSPPALRPPSNLRYSVNPGTYTIYSQVAPNQATVEGGAVELFLVSPALPQGLALNPSTGLISGTPTVLSGAAAYTVTAQNAAGSAQTLLSIEVRDQAPRALSYAVNPATYVGGSVIPPNAPSSGGGAVTLYTVSPSLPVGLELHPGTGVISGTPLAVLAARAYTVTASNSGGSTTADVVIAVAAPAGPAITSQPASQRVLPGQRATFVVAATGTGALAYQWRRAGAPVVGANSATFETEPLGPTDDGAVFDVVVSDSFGSSTTSSGATVSVGGFVPAGSMTSARTSHFAAPLPGGRVLVAGGLQFTGNPGSQVAVFLDSAEVFDPATGQFTPTGSLTEGRASSLAVPLADGRVLVVGGLGAGSAYLASAEVYDPGTGRFSAVGSMASPRTNFIAVRLGNDKVLVAGGFTGSVVLGAAELFDPVTDTFSPTGGMGSPRNGHAAAALLDGRVLVAGGHAGGATFPVSAELYDPRTGEFTGTGDMATPRYAFGVAGLQDGRVLVVGGLDGNSYMASAEVYDPGTGSFAPAGGMAFPRAGGTVVALSNGKVLVAGGQDMSASGAIVSSCEIFSPAGGLFEPAMSMSKPKTGMTATQLGSGKVLLAGGSGELGAILSEAEVWTNAP